MTVAVTKIRNRLDSFLTKQVQGQRRILLTKRSTASSVMFSVQSAIHIIIPGQVDEQLILHQRGDERSKRVHIGVGDKIKAIKEEPVFMTSYDNCQIDLDWHYERCRGHSKRSNFTWRLDNQVKRQPQMWWKWWRFSKHLVRDLPEIPCRIPLGKRLQKKIRLISFLNSVSLVRIWLREVFQKEGRD